MDLQEGYMNNLRNRMYACLCTREGQGEWEKNLDSILTELLGISEEKRSINFYKIWYKLSACRYLSYEYFRKNILDAMGMMK